MLYRPKYCCNCGERIERAAWPLTASRRFCELCETEFKGADLVPRAVVAIGVLLSLFGFHGLFFGGAAPGPPAVSRPQPAALKPRTETPASAAAMPGAAAQPSPPAAKTTEQPPIAAKSSEQPAYYCGALTKKGTPCSRRVKIKGTRCWQHSGADE